MRVKHPFTGESIPIEVRAFLIRDPEDGAPIGMAGIGRDLSDRKRVEKALRLSEEKFAKAFRITPDAVNINRMRDGLYVEINEGFTRATGYEVEDVIGKSSLDLNIWHDPAERDELIRRLKEHGEVLNFEAKFRGRRPIGHGVDVLPALAIDGETYILSITRDITDRIRCRSTPAGAEMEAWGASRGDRARLQLPLTDIVGYCYVLSRPHEARRPGTAELQGDPEAGKRLRPHAPGSTRFAGSRC